jgi:cell fate (sporulation/competence/biofilm development) regulator YlbF (YheA/YmcA/DUF963 family)
MRKSATGLLLFISVNIVGVANASYVISLKNGNEYVTNRYWQVGTQILFDAEGGVFGIDKAFVIKIEKTDKVIKLLTHANPDSLAKPEVALQETGNDVTKEAPVTAAKTPASKDENDPIYKEFTALKAQSDSLPTMSRGELDEYVKKVVGLISKIQNDRKINQYRQEYSELNALANSVEDAIKSRR